MPGYDYGFNVTVIGDSEVDNNFLASTFLELDPNRKQYHYSEDKEI